MKPQLKPQGAEETVFRKPGISLMWFKLFADFPFLFLFLKTRVRKSNELGEFIFLFFICFIVTQLVHG